MGLFQGMRATGKQVPNQVRGPQPAPEDHGRQEIEASIFNLRAQAYLSKSFRFCGEGHSSWKLAEAHTLAWLSTRYLRWECTCRAKKATCELLRHFPNPCSCRLLKMGHTQTQSLSMVRNKTTVSTYKSKTALYREEKPEKRFSEVLREDKQWRWTKEHTRG